MTLNKSINNGLRPQVPEISVNTLFWKVKNFILKGKTSETETKLNRSETLKLRENDSDKGRRELGVVMLREQIPGETTTKCNV